MTSVSQRFGVVPDSIECLLKSGSTTLDQIAMKTLPALAAIPASLQAVTFLSCSDR